MPNVRVSGELVLRLGDRRTHYRAVELAPTDALVPEVLRAYLARWHGQVGAFFAGVGPQSSDAELSAVADNHPVFGADGAMTALPRIAPEPPPPQRTDRLGQIVVAAQQLLAAEGVDGLSMRRLAQVLGIKAPSLYKHLAHRDELVQHLVAYALLLMGKACHHAVDRPGGAGRSARCCTPTGRWLTTTVVPVGHRCWNAPCRVGART